MSLDARRAELAATMVGFDSLIEVVQAFLAGWSVVTGEVWETTDIEATRAIAIRLVNDLAAMVAAFGVEQ